MKIAHRCLAAIAAAAALAATPSAFAADKITLMVGGYEKIIYLPSWPSGWATSRPKGSMSRS